MSAKHTPGPWIVDNVSEKNLYVLADQGKNWNNPTVCALYEDVTPEDSVTLGPWLKSFDNAEANARLIASAPDLLAACQAMHDALSEILESCASADRDGEINHDRDNEYEIGRDHRAQAKWSIRKSFKALAKAGEFDK